MSSGTIHVSVSIDNEIDPIELNFLTEKLNWENLVTLIQSATELTEIPVTLYFKKTDVIESLNSQEQLQELLGNGDIKGLRFYGQRELVNENVFVFPGNAFVRLGQLIDQHKEIVSSSHRIARWVGILASFIAQDTTDYDFDYEFEVLEKLIAKKTNKRSRRQQKQQQEQNDDDIEVIEVEEEHEEDPRMAFPGTHGPFGGHPGGRGGFFGFGGRGGCGGRGGHHDRGGHHSHHHPREFMSGRGGHCRGRGGSFGAHHGGHADFARGFEHHGSFGGKHEGFGKGHFGGWGHHGPHYNPFDFAGVQDALGEDKTSDKEDFGCHPSGPSGEEFHGFPDHHHGGPFGRRHHGGKHGFGFGHPFDGEKFGRCDRKKFRRHGHPYGRGGQGSSSEESSSEEEIRNIRKYLLMKHLKHDKHFPRHFENHFHFAA